MYVHESKHVTGWRAIFFFVSKHQGWLAWVGDENEKILPIRETPGDADDEEAKPVVTFSSWMIENGY